MEIVIVAILIVTKSHTKLKLNFKILHHKKDRDYWWFKSFGNNKYLFVNMCPRRI